ncbi:multicopper oxidase domain-containing protein [Sinomonas atrocyanea]|uniref:multicopper oxidase domain-containing protein n=1 Tax=Sinomonas atrocyanea TaxID=37927 RepID=UPI0027850EA5|nr:multicopper oxidase domain-containing protein [Sinomonas atrocyanea]MDQ0259714.1 nitrite reductase (NO-forming) [Sinomonas atrocyanea]MDR6621679.1 nitrite reductase (NO-forming) [Sinomonas atrocyanea]
MMPTVPPAAADPAAPGRQARTGRAQWHRWANAPTLVWLLAIAVLSGIHRGIPASGWLLVHLALLGAATNAILVYSWHFAEALLRLPVPSRRALAARLVLLNVGAAAAMAGVVAGVWPLAVSGAAAVGAAAGWHGAALLVRLRRALASRFRSTLRYYLAACAILPFGAAAGALLALPGTDDGGDLHARLLLAHESLNLLGWVGLSVLGTLVTLLPTMLRTRADDSAEPIARRALWVLLAGVGLAAGGALAGVRAAAGAGVVLFLAGVLVSAVPLARAVRRKAPVAFAPLSAVASLVWLVGALARLAWLCLAAPDWDALHVALGGLTPALAAGFAAQVLAGALSYLLPVVLGGGPAAVRRRTETLDAGAWLRVALANGALALYLLPVPSAVRVAAAVAGLAALVGFVWLAGRAFLGRPGRDPGARGERERRPGGSGPVEAGASVRSRLGSGAVGLAVLLAAVVAGVAADPSVLPVAGGGSPAAAAGGSAVAPTGHTTTVDVAMSGMRFVPGTVSVPAGDRLVIRLANKDQTAHDLVLATGQDSSRIYPGRSGELDAGVMAQSVDGWCSVVGHRQMGMVFRVSVTGAPQPSAAAAPAPGSMDMPGMQPASSGAPAAAHTPYPADLPAVPPGTVHRVTLTVRDTVAEVAPGVTQTLWTYNGTAPGPVLHGRVGDTFEVTLVNDASAGHSIDFHAGALAPDGPMRTIDPGQRLTYTFRATEAGIWMYHCSTMPMSLHIANGMFGAMVVDPPDAPPVDHEFVLVQSEQYRGAASNGAPGIADSAKITAGTPDAVVFNGYPNQYDAAPLAVRAGERVRVWVLDAGPGRATSFHVVGAQFGAVWAEGAYRLAPGPGGTQAGASQALDLLPAQGGFVDLTFPEAGHYPFVSHYTVDAERGAHGVFDVAAAK